MSHRLAVGFVEDCSVNARAEALEARLEPLMLIVALLVIPDVAIEASDVTGSWARVALVLNWTVWITFAIALVTTTIAAGDRWRWLRSRPLDVAIVVLTPPFAPAVLLGFRLARLLRFLRLLRLARTANLTRRAFSAVGGRVAGETSDCTRRAWRSLCCSLPPS